MKQFRFLSAFLLLATAAFGQVSGTTNIGPVSTPRLNGNFYVGAKPFLTIQSAVTAACALGTTARVVVPSTATPSDTIAAAISCSTVSLVDDRATPSTTYSTSGTTFAAVSAGGSSSAPGTANQVQTTNGSGALTATPVTADVSGNFTVPKFTTLGTTSYSTPFLIPSGSHPGNTTYSDISSTFMVAGSGWNLGNSGGWSVQKGLVMFLNDHVRGITQGINITLNKDAGGDSSPFYVYNNYDGGQVDQSGEGSNGATFEDLESGSSFVGKVGSTAGTGDQHPVFTITSGNSWLTDGAYVLDITKGTLAGSVSAFGSNAGSTNFRTLTVTGVTLPLTTAWGTFVSIANQNTSADSPLPVTLTVTLQTVGGTPQPFVTGPAVIAGYTYLEQSTITAVGTPSGTSQSITLLVRSPNNVQTGGISGAIFQGGIAGNALSWDYNYTVTGRRSSYPVLGSLTGTDLIYAFPLTGSTTGAVLPLSSEPAGANFPANTAFHLYPYAEVVGKTTTGYTGETLEPNNVAWAANDVVENPHSTAQAGTGLRVVWLPRSPQSSNSTGLLVDVAGTGMTYGTNAALIRNSGQAANFYANKFAGANNGPMTAPAGLQLSGSFSTPLYIFNGPQPGYNLITVQNLFGGIAPASWTDPIGVISMPTAVGGTNALVYTPATGVWSVGGQFSASSLSVNNGTTSVTSSGISFSSGLTSFGPVIGTGTTSCTLCVFYRDSSHYIGNGILEPLGGTYPFLSTIVNDTADNNVSDSFYFNKSPNSATVPTNADFIMQPTGFSMAQGIALGWSNNNTGAGTINAAPALDTQLTRSASGVVSVDTTTAGNAAGTIKAAAVLIGGTGTVTAATFTPSTLYSAAGTALPTCAVGIKGQLAVVSDATSPTYMGAYTSGGSVTTAVVCSYNGTAYSWLTH